MSAPDMAEVARLVDEVAHLQREALSEWRGKWIAAAPAPPDTGRGDRPNATEELTELLREAMQGLAGVQEELNAVRKRIADRLAEIEQLDARYDR